MSKALPLICGAALIFGGASFALALPASPHHADTGADTAVVEIDNNLYLDIDDSDDRFGADDSDDGQERRWRPQWDDRPLRALPHRAYDRHGRDADFDDSDSDFGNSDSD